MKKFFQLDQSGFSITELMICLVAISVLSSVATVQFQKYKEKALAAEVKIALTSIYTAENSFYGEFGTYASCLADMGFDPGHQQTRYFAIGFPSASGDQNNQARANGAHCSDVELNQAYFPAGKVVNGEVAQTPVGGQVNYDSFVASAYAKKIQVASINLLEKLSPFPSAYASVYRGPGNEDDFIRDHDIWYIDSHKKFQNGRYTSSQGEDAEHGPGSCK